MSYKVVEEEEKKSILFADDLAKIQSIFLEYIHKDREEGVHERVSLTLLGIWYFDDLTGKKKSEERKRNKETRRKKERKEGRKKKQIFARGSK